MVWLLASQLSAFAESSSAIIAAVALLALLRHK
jgi:hypothetical protein